MSQFRAQCNTIHLLLCALSVIRPFNATLSGHMLVCFLDS